MAKSQWSRLVTAGGASLLVAAVVLGMLPGTAGAASTYTAQANGRGLQVSLAGNGIGDDQLAPRVADTDRDPAPDGDGVADCVAATDPDGCVTGPTVESIVGIPILANILSAGVIAQDAFVDDSGTSKACSGLVGPGGQVSVDETPEGCLVANPTSPGGVVVNLANGIPLNLYRIRADAITGECSATAGDPEADPPVPASATGTSHTVNVVIDTVVSIPLVGDVFVPILTLPATSAPNSQVLFPAGPFEALNDLISLRLNEQTVGDNGARIDVTALHLTVLAPAPGGGLLDVKIGQVSCGTNTATPMATTSSTSSSSTSTTTEETTSSTSSSTTSTTTEETTSSTSSSTTSTTVEPTTSSSTPTTIDPGSSSTSSSSTLPAVTTSTTRAPLAKSGVNTRTQLSIALGLLGLGMVVTGRGMQLGFDGPDRRRK